MNKKKAKQQKSLNRIEKYFIKNTQPQEELEQPSLHSSESCKKIIVHPNSFDLTADKQQTLHSAHKKVPFINIMKNIQIYQVLAKCPRIKTMVEVMSKKVNLNKKLINNILKKYLQSNQHSLWNIKYAPKSCAELFNIQAGQQIKNWLDAFFQYKNKIRQQSESFINDFDSQDHNSCKVYKNMMKNRWQLSALVIKGRPGIGKTSAIRAVANQMAIDLQQCGNHYNQTKYLKEKNQSTQSESVKTAISKKVKHEKNSQMITKFLPLIQKQKILEAKKSQVIHNVGLIYPQNQSQKFYNQLSRCIQLSKIPFIMTNLSDKLPRECQKYDIIQFQHGQANKIEQILWVIYHIQKLCCLNTCLMTDSCSIFQQINKQCDKLQFSQILTINKIQQLCHLYNYNLDYIFTFLQYQPGIDTINFHKLLLEKAKKYEDDSFLKEINLLNLDLFKQQTVEKMQDVDNTKDTQQAANDNDMRNVVQRLNIIKYQDQMQKIQPENSQFTNFMNISQWEGSFSMCINPDIHYKIKSKLVKKINQQVGTGFEKCRSTLKPHQLGYLPMLIKQKRNSRSHKGTQQFYMKYFDENESAYLKKYGNLIKQF